MARRLLDSVPEFGFQSYFHGVDSFGRGVIETTQDAEDIVKLNQHKADNLDRKSNMWFIGSVPLTLCQKWATESKTKVFTKEWQKYAIKQMNLPEYKKLNPGRIRI